MHAPELDVQAFYEGRRAAIAAVYQAHFATVYAAVGRYVTGADQETLVHEIFLRLLEDESMRRRFRGGNMAAWLSTVARNHTVDFVRRAGRECPLPDGDPPAVDPAFERRAEARHLIERFRRDYLPEGLRSVFEARYVERLTTRQAAQKLGMARSTLALRELKLASLIRRFIREHP